MGKPRESKFTAHAETIVGWFEAEPELRLIDAVERLAQLKVTATPGELSRFLARYRDDQERERMLTSIATGAQKCREIDDAFSRNPAPELSLLISLLKNLILHLNLSKDTPQHILDRATGLLRPVMEFAKLEQKQREAELDLEKFRDATRSKVEAGLDEIAALFRQAPELQAEFEGLRAKLTARLAE